MISAQKCPTCGATLTLNADGGRCLRCLLGLAIAPDEPLAASSGDTRHFEQPGDRIGRYKLLQQIGEGGCGVVYMAEQLEPVLRRVALKVIKLGMDTRSVVARFEAERQAMALMDHQNIAKVLDAGATDSGRPFFVMELVRGAKITKFCDQNNLSTRERLVLFVQVCNAIQHAHQKGVIHRDIKPSNILVTLHDGVPLPKVIDFGIAKATQQPLTDKTLFTAFEQFIGTPAYMSPEQAEMNVSGVDTRSDIYSLGVLLYELLTGKTPFDAKSLLQSGIDEIRRIIREQEPAQPSTRLSTLLAGELATTADHRRIEGLKLISLVRGDLDWIVMKALEKDRARRYETANGLAMDVRRHLYDEPVVARPPDNFYRFQKMVRRNKLVFAASSAVLAALVIGLVVSSWQFLEKSQAEREQNRLREEAQKQELVARRKAYAVSVNLIQQALAADNLGRAVELLDQQRPEPGQEDLRGWEWRYLWQFCRSDARASLCTRSNAITELSFSSDGTLLAVGTEAGELSVWDIARKNMILRSGESCECYTRIAFAPGSGLLAYYDYGQTNLVLWDSLVRAEVRRLPIGERLHIMSFLSETRLLTAELLGTNNITIWDTATGRPLTHTTAPIFLKGPGARFAASPDGAVLAYAISNNLVRVENWAQGGHAWDFQATDELTTAFALSPDGKILATGAGYTESAIKLWNVQTRQFLGQLEGHRSWIERLKFLPDGTLASASGDQTVRLWDVAARQPLRTLRGHRSEARALDISRDGRTLASGGKDGTVLLWDVASATKRPPGWSTVAPSDKPGIARGVEISPDSRTIAVLESDSVRLYDATTLRPVQKLDLALTNAAPRLLFSPDSHLLVAADASGRLSVWDLPGRRLVTNFPAHVGTAGLLGVSFQRGGKSVLTWGTNNIGREWDTTSWKETAHWPLTEQGTPFRYLYSASSPDGLLAIKVGDDSFIQLFSVSDPMKRRKLACSFRTVGIALSPDENTIAGACEDGTLAVYDTRTLSTNATTRNVLLGLHSVVFSPDGRRIVAGGNGREAIKIWDANSHEDLATLEGKGSLFASTRFSSDGNMIAACGWSGILHVWRAPSWQEINATERIRPEAR